MEGLTWSFARQKLSDTVEEVLEQEESKLASAGSTWKEALKQSKSQGLVLLCAVMLIVGHALSSSSIPAESLRLFGNPTAWWIMIGFLLCTNCLNVWLCYASLECQEYEALVRLSDALDTFKRQVDRHQHRTTIPLTSVGAASQANEPILKQGSSLVSIYAVLRDGQWQRIPALLLVENDIIAMGIGDTTPGCVQQLPSQPNPAHPLSPTAGQGQNLAAGARVEFRADKQVSFIRKCTIPSTSPSLLLLCGDIRCFRMKETPIVTFLHEALDSRKVKPTEPLFSKYMSLAINTASRCAIGFVAALLLIACLRFIWFQEERKAWPLHVLVEPACLALLALPSSGPLMVFLTEVISTAGFLTFIERLQRQPSSAKKENGGDSDHHHQVGTPHRFDEMDVDQRIKLRSKTSRQGRVSTLRFWVYLWATIQTRLFPRRRARIRKNASSSPADSHSAPGSHVVGMNLSGTKEEEDEEEQDLLPIPLLSSRAWQRLGAVTMLSMVDDELVCEESSSPEEVFLFNSKLQQEASSTVLRVMHDPSNSSTGLKFEDPFWWKHMASLKPIGFTCLTTTQPSGDQQQTTTDAEQVTSHKDKKSRASLDNKQEVAPMADTDLVRFVTKVPGGRKYVSNLGREVGFCDADLSSFREKSRIHVMAPHLADEQVMEDTHALSVEESRNRGTLQPHVTSVVLEDIQRNGGMQLLSQGTPVLAVPMCYDYWDGQVITTLTAENRRLILETHQQWTLEDFDVIAFTYTPIPPVLSRRLGQAPIASLPIYMVDNYTEAQQVAHLNFIREQATQERQARLAQAQGQGSNVKDDKEQQQEEHQQAQPQEEEAHQHSIREEANQQEDQEEPGLPLHIAPSRRETRTESDAIGLDLSGGMGISKSRASSATGRMIDTHHHTIAFSSNTPADPAFHEGEKRQQDDDASQTVASYSARFDRSGSASMVAAAGGARSRGSVAMTPEKAMLSMSMPSLPRSSTDPSLSTRGHKTMKNALDEPQKPLPTLDDLILPRKTTSGGPSRLRFDHHHASSSLSQLAASRLSGGAAAGHADVSDELLWGLLQRQVFLGMVASSVLPRKEMPSVVEEMMASGVRFMYFSPRNMRRTKALAEKLGVEMDWNCALSLRPLKSSDMPDEHRIIGEGTYGDWDVKARLPHGIEAIRRHLEKVDNVPLLVSIYTDSTPMTIDAMFKIFHDYYESVLCVGCAFRSSNAQLFRRADLSISFEGLPSVQHISSLPSYSMTRLSAVDARFNEDLISLYCAFSLRHASSSSKQNKRRVSASLLVDLVREGRRVVYSLYQMVALGIMILTTAALLLVICRIIPLYTGSTGGLGLEDVLWMVWVVLPLLCLPLLHTPADSDILTRCTRKNHIKSIEASRTLSYLAWRCIPTVIICLYIHARAIITLLDQIPEVLFQCHVTATTSTRVSALLRSSPLDWWTLLRCRAGPSSGVTNALLQADDLMLAASVLMLTTQSASLLYRTAPLVKENVFRNIAWVLTCLLLISLQAAYLLLRAWSRGSLSALAGVGWDIWMMMVVGPWLVLLIGEYAKRQDKKVFDKAIRFLRLQFDTRLGTHSPK